MTIGMNVPQSTCGLISPLLFFVPYFWFGHEAQLKGAYRSTGCAYPFPKGSRALLWVLSVAAIIQSRDGDFRRIHPALERPY
ncbi:hypothetical protein DIPPA_31433 [Diplonema papillatum]|nr:hypothetical protein DIPPA_31433 [Diplonema papillatum]